MMLEYGTIQPDTIVLLYTGQSQYWPSAAKYLGTDQKGPEAIGYRTSPITSFAVLTTTTIGYFTFQVFMRVVRSCW